MASPLLPKAETLRILSIDGGGVKGYTSLLILQRIFRTLQDDNDLPEMPRPCEVFDLIAGTSTGGLIAVMLGRLHMTIEECIRQYETIGAKVFAKSISTSVFGKAKSLASLTAYKTETLQLEIRNLLETKNINTDEMFAQSDKLQCKVY